MVTHSYTVHLVRLAVSGDFLNIFYWTLSHHSSNIEEATLYMHINGYLMVYMVTANHG